MNRSTAIALTKKAIREITADALTASDFNQDFGGVKMWVTLATRGGNKLAHVYGEIKVSDDVDSFEFEVHGAKSSMIKQPYRKPDKVVKKGFGVVMQDGDLKWIIGS